MVGEYVCVSGGSVGLRFNIGAVFNRHDASDVSGNYYYFCLVARALNRSDRIRSTRETFQPDRMAFGAFNPGANKLPLVGHLFLLTWFMPLS
jgi:hypothetical protein